jgi:hypothetical protein
MMGLNESAVCEYGDRLTLCDQAIITINEDDKIYLIVQNKSSTGNITIEFMNMIVVEVP